jgi:uncharacterized repeat protein (TIGR01451 family)
LFFVPALIAYLVLAGQKQARWMVVLTVAMLALARDGNAAASADLSVSASATPEPVGVGSNLVYSLTVSNAGPSAVTAVVISDQLPASFGFVSATGFFTYSNRLLLLNFSSIAVGATGSAQVVVQPGAAGQVTNLFQASASVPDPAPANNTAAVVSTVTNGTVIVPLPGTPVAGWNDPGGATVIIPEGGGIGEQPVTNSSGLLPVTPGEIVLLKDPNGGTNISNWKALVSFFGSDGFQGLTATNYITFFESNPPPNFFHFTQFASNIAFVPISATNADGSVTANIHVFGPVGGIPAGQEAIIQLTAALQPSPGPPTIAIYYPSEGEQFGNVQEFGVDGSWAQSLSSEAPITGIFVQLNGGTPVNAVFGEDALGDLYFYTVDPLTPIPGTNTVSATIIDGLGNASTNTVLIDYVPFTGGTNTPGIPGTMSTIWDNPIFINPAEIANIPQGGGIGVRGVDSFLGSPTVLPGDVVMLVNTNNGNSFTNWKAVVQFFNPDDPTGTLGLAATEYETFFQTNASPNYFANFQLMSNVVYVPIAVTNADGSVTANINVRGPVGAIIAGQLVVLNITASIQPDPFALTITSPLTGQEVGSALITVTGTTTNSVAAASNVLVQLNGGGWTGATTADGWTNWSKSVTLTPGPNTLDVYAVDFLGNFTATNTVFLDYVTDVSHVADISLSGMTGPQSGTFGTNLVYFLTVSNAGPSAATGVAISDQLPPGNIFYSATGGATPTNGLLIVNVGSLAVGATNLIQIAIQPTNGFGTLTNLIQVFANQTDPDLTNNSVIVASALFPFGYKGQNTEDSAEYDTLFTSNVTQQVTNYSTELIARLPNGTVLYDQTFNASYSDPTVQAAVTQAAGLLNGAGAPAYTGPAQTGNSQTLVGSSTVTVPNNTNVTYAVKTFTWIGPQTILVGDFGVVQAYTIDPVSGTFAYPAGWNGTPAALTLLPGYFDVDTTLLALSDIYQTTTLTSNYLDSAVYSMTGIVAQADLKLTASGPAYTEALGDTLTYNLEVTNRGPTTATGLVISNQIPAGVTFVSTAIGNAPPNNGVLSVQLSSLAVGSTYSFQIVVQPNVVGTLTNAFQVFANETDPVPADNIATVINTITNASAIAGNPGTPMTWSSQGLSPILVQEGVGIGNGIGGVYSIVLLTPQIFGFSAMTTLPGDVVFLTDPNGGTNTSNWTAVLHFFNPGDTNGTQGLVATEFRTFFPTNAGPNAFANFPLFPNVIYVPIAATNADGSVTAITNIFGPVAGVATNQEVVLHYNASIVSTIPPPGTNTDLGLIVSTPDNIGPVSPLERLAYLITVTNLGPQTASDVVVSNQLPANVNFISANVVTNIVHNGNQYIYPQVAKFVPTNGVLTVNLGQLASGAVQSFFIAVQPTVPGQITNAFRLSADQTDPVLANNLVTVVSTVTNVPPPGIPGTPYAGFWNPLVFLNTNGLANSDAANANITNTVQSIQSSFSADYDGNYPSNAIPGDVVILLDPNGGTNTSNWGAVVRFFNPGDPTGTNGWAATHDRAFFPADVGAGGFANFKLFPTVTFFTGSIGSTLSNNPAPGDFATVRTEVGPDVALTGGEVEIFILQVFNSDADLSLRASAAPEPIGVGSNLVYSISITNQGPNPASGVTVSNQMPVGLTFVSATGGVTPSSGGLLWNVGSLTNGAVTNVQVIVQPTVAGKLTNVFQVFADQPDPLPANNSAAVISTVANAPVVAANLSLSATGNYPSNVSVGIGFSNLIFSITISNAGPSAASGVVVSNQIPANTTFMSASGGATPTNGVLLLNLGSLAVGATNSVQITLDVPIYYRITNGFQVFADQTDPNLANNSTNLIIARTAFVTTSSITSETNFTSTVNQQATNYSTELIARLANGTVLFDQTYNATFPNATVQAAVTQAAADLTNAGATSYTGPIETTSSQTLVNSTSVMATNVIGTGVSVSVTTYIGPQTILVGPNQSQVYPIPAGDQDIDTLITSVVTNLVTTTNTDTYANSTVYVMIGAVAQADLKLSASAAPEPVTVGSNLIYSISITNQGPNTASGVMVSNSIPVGVNFVSATGGATPSSGILLMNFGSLATGTVTNAQITVQPTAAGNLSNTFQVFANEFDPNVTNNAATVVSTITNAASTVTTFSTSTAEYDTILTSNVNQQTTNFSTELIARLPNGTIVFDQTFNAAYSNPTVQSAITTAAGDLTGAGASSYTGPTQTSFSQALANIASFTVTNSINTNISAVTTAYLGPQTIQTGNFGVYQRFTNSGAYAGPMGGNPQPLPIAPGSEDIDTFVTNALTFFETRTTTSNFLNTAVYAMTGAVAQVDVALSLMAAPNPVAVGAPLTYLLAVTNNSSTTATGVVVSNTLPPNVTVLSLLPSQGAASNQAAIVTYTIGSLSNGVAATLAITVVPSAAGLLTNTAVAISAQTDSQPANNRATNIASAITVVITNLVPTVLSPITLNPQTGLFEQQVEVANGGPSTPSSVLLLVSGLAANAKLYNALGITNGLPYVQSSSALGVGSNIVFLMEYYVPTRVMPTNLTYLVEAGTVFIPPLINGTIFNIGRVIMLPNGNALVEFSAVPGQVYAIQYSSDMVTWQTAVPVITAPANRVQWIDAGPPQTDSSPTQQSARYYRVVLLGAH